MTCIAKPDAYAPSRGKRLAIRHTPDLSEHRARLIHVVERREGTSLTLGTLGLGLLKVSAVEQQHGQQVRGGGRRVDRSPEALGEQPRKEAAVVQMRMGQDDEVERPGIEGKGLHVLLALGATALEKAAVDGKPARGEGKEKAGAGDLARRATELQVHALLIVTAVMERELRSIRTCLRNRAHVAAGHVERASAQTFRGVMHVTEPTAASTAVRERLLRRRDELLSRSKRVSADMRHESDPLSADSTEQAVQRANDDVLGAIGESAAKELAQLDVALQKLDANRYGLCEDCGAPIEVRRLAAVPYAVQCQRCVEIASGS